MIYSRRKESEAPLATRETVNDALAGGNPWILTCHSGVFVLRAARISATERLFEAPGGELPRMAENKCAARKENEARHTKPRFPAASDYISSFVDISVQNS